LFVWESEKRFKWARNESYETFDRRKLKIRGCWSKKISHFWWSIGFNQKP